MLLIFLLLAGIYTATARQRLESFSTRATLTWWATSTANTNPRRTVADCCIGYWARRLRLPPTTRKKVPTWLSRMCSTTRMAPPPSITTARRRPSARACCRESFTTREIEYNFMFNVQFNAQEIKLPPFLTSYFEPDDERDRVWYLQLAIKQTRGSLFC